MANRIQRRTRDRCGYAPMKGSQVGAPPIWRFGREPNWPVLPGRLRELPGSSADLGSRGYLVRTRWFDLGRVVHPDAPPLPAACDRNRPPCCSPPNAEITWPLLHRNNRMENNVLTGTSECQPPATEGARPRTDNRLKGARARHGLDTRTGHLSPHGGFGRMFHVKHRSSLDLGWYAGQDRHRGAANE